MPKKNRVNKNTNKNFLLSEIITDPYDLSSFSNFGFNFLVFKNMVAIPNPIKVKKFHKPNKKSFFLDMLSSKDFPQPVFFTSSF
jgi:hypothetical protein